MRSTRSTQQVQANPAPDTERSARLNPHSLHLPRTQLGLLPAARRRQRFRSGANDARIPATA